MPTLGLRPRLLSRLGGQYKLASTPKIGSQVAAAGHTPGHSGFRVVSGDDALFILGDIVHATALQMARPDWGIVFDTDPEKAVATRVRAFQDAARNKRLIAGMHLPFPGIGHVSEVGAGFQFHSLNWAYHL